MTDQQDNSNNKEGNILPHLKSIQQKLENLSQKAGQVGEMKQKLDQQIDQKIEKARSSKYLEDFRNGLASMEKKRQDYIKNRETRKRVYDCMGVTGGVILLSKGIKNKVINGTITFGLIGILSVPEVFWPLKK